MSQTGKLMPNLDQNSTKVLNLTVLQRMDPYIEEILITAAHVTFYEFNIDLNQWVCITTCLLDQFIFFVFGAIGLIRFLLLLICWCLVAESQGRGGVFVCGQEVRVIFGIWDSEIEVGEVIMMWILSEGM